MPKNDDDMRLPAGKTCGDCSSYNRCNKLFGCFVTNVSCDFAPSRFVEKKPPAADAKGEGRRVMATKRLRDTCAWCKESLSPVNKCECGAGMSDPEYHFVQCENCEPQVQLAAIKKSVGEYLKSVLILKLGIKCHIDGTCEKNEMLAALQIERKQRVELEALVNEED